MLSRADSEVVQLHNSGSFPIPPAARAVEKLAARRRTLSEALRLLAQEAGRVDAAAQAMVRCLRAGGTVLTAGNGGSAAEAQHLATELVGRFLRERAPYAVLALTADTAVLSALANDYGFEAVFARQVAAHGRPGDVLVALSTSGESRNLVAAADVARRRGMTVVALTGAAGGPLADRASIPIRVPADDTPVVQELHTVVLHVLCDLVEGALAGDGASAADGAALDGALGAVADGAGDGAAVHAVGAYR